MLMSYEDRPLAGEKWRTNGLGQSVDVFCGVTTTMMMTKATWGVPQKESTSLP
jgi:hypothetical protein